MGVAITNAIIAWVNGIAHYFATMPASHAFFWSVLGYFAATSMPPRVPRTPQDLWTWARDIVQGVASTKALPHPTQPAPTVPEQPKP
ncbi:MAG: hypothetical protein KGL39_47415 [Patescibacteria group bacterium]|nr:hypothetical protein [Patescibacteria group bacterium]